MNSFVALDFETALGKRFSMCAVGLVVVKNYSIIEKKWALIQPPNNEYHYMNINVHKITPEMTQNAPTFPEFYPKLKPYLQNNIVVCHNADFDIDVFNQTMSYYGIVNDINFEICCTLSRFGARLNDCCKLYNIDLNHHDPLSDAEACAKLFIISEGGSTSCSDQIISAGSYTIPVDGRQNITGDVLKPDLINVENINNPFYNKKVVISGTYETWPDRTDLAKILKNLGADIDTSVSKRTNILCAGTGVGPSKIRKMQQNIEEGFDSIILSEKEIIELLTR